MAGRFFDRLYSKLPVFLQNTAVSLYGWKLARIRYGGAFFRHLESLRKSQWWGAETILDYQTRRMRDLLAAAYRDVPFYRRWFDHHGVDVESVRSLDDLARLPVLTKDEVRRNQASMVSTAFPRRSLIPMPTSGTTGTPLAVWMTRDAAALQWAFWWRHKARFGLTPGSRHLSFGGKAPVPQSQSRPPYWRHDIFGHRTYMSVYHISQKTVRDILDYLNRSRFEFYTGASSGLYVLSSAIEESGFKLTSRPKWIVCGADVVLPAHVRSFEKNFGSPVTEQYGMSEFAGNMSKCELGRFHVDFECGIVEHIPVEGTGLSRLILTGWGNPAMPFIRYEVGDLVKPVSGPCGCGRESACFESVDGRLEDYVLTPDGRRLMGMNQVLMAAENVKEIQIFQDSVTAVEFRIVPGDLFGEADKQALKREFTRRAGPGMDIRFRLVESLQQAPSGKLRAVISEPAARMEREVSSRNR